MSKNPATSKRSEVIDFLNFFVAIILPYLTLLVKDIFSLVPLWGV